MATTRLSYEIAKATLDLVAKHNGNVNQAGAASGVSRSTFRSRYENAKAMMDAPSPVGPTQSESVSGTGDSCEVTKTTHERVRTLADLIRVCDIDVTEWVIERWVCNKWDTAAKLGKDEAERIAVTELYQVKVWLKRNRDAVAVRTELADLVADAKKKLPKLSRLAPKLKKPTGMMLELNVADLHVGKLAWGKETGGGNYDSKLAEALHDEAVEALLQRTSVYAFDEILIVLGNDLLHIDTRANTTTAGTPQDTDSRYFKLFQATRRMSRRLIERCRTVAKVHVVMVPGNHDKESVWHLGDTLECLYENCPDVTIDNAPRTRKYKEFGKVMLMLTHGDKGKREDYPLTMATEESAMFGRTLYREAHTGHLHQTKVQEYHGVRVRVLPSLADADSWHAENGYVGNIRAAEAFAWSADGGLLSTHYYTISADRLRDEAA
jgi:predicted phosphodiesterase